MSKLFSNCFCRTRKEHVRELEKDHRTVFDRVCNGSDELDECIKITQEINKIQSEGYWL